MDAHVTAQSSPIATVNPYTGERVREFPALSAEDVGRAIDAAHRGFPNWRAQSTADRAAECGVSRRPRRVPPPRPGWIR
ncbi:aldehyde dehydrogenase family protein [Streptomyces sp. NPDC093250]|uniref:aldehyde dehydrogenase family protein n=1 Tax=Streptomyces sp. NPDC093250 TaxID=3366036 RepID=UPI00381B1DE5